MHLTCIYIHVLLMYYVRVNSNLTRITSGTFPSEICCIIVYAEKIHGTINRLYHLNSITTYQFLSVYSICIYLLCMIMFFNINKKQAVLTQIQCRLHRVERYTCFKKKKGMIKNQNFQEVSLHSVQIYIFMIYLSYCVLYLPVFRGYQTPPINCVLSAPRYAIIF